MAFTGSISALNNSCLSAFSESFVYKKPNGDVTLTGIFGESVNGVTLGRMATADKTYEISLLKSSVETAEIELRQSVLIRGIEYQIINIQSDETDMTKLILRRYK